MNVSRVLLLAIINSPICSLHTHYTILETPQDVYWGCDAVEHTGPQWTACTIPICMHGHHSCLYGSPSSHTIKFGAVLCIQNHDSYKSCSVMSFVWWVSPLWFWALQLFCRVFPRKCIMCCKLNFGSCRSSNLIYTPLAAWHVSLQPLGLVYVSYYMQKLWFTVWVLAVMPLLQLAICITQI